jgi:metal iron transporter
MNCPAKTEPIVSDGHNQNPYILCPELTTRSDLGKIANARLQREHSLRDPEDASNTEVMSQPPSKQENDNRMVAGEKVGGGGGGGKVGVPQEQEKSCSTVRNRGLFARPDGQSPKDIWRKWPSKVLKVLRTYLKFVGPGFMVAVVSTT